MKKLLLSLVALMTFGVSAWAQVETTDVSGYNYAIYTPDVEGIVGQTFKLPIYMKNAENVASLQFSIVLPGDMADTFSKAGLNPDRFNADNGGTVYDANKQPDGSVTVIATVIHDDGFTPDDAPICYLNIPVSTDMAVGEYPIIIKATELSGIGNVATKSEKITEEITSKLTIFDKLYLSEDDVELASSFTIGASNVNVEVKRTMKANKWNTVVLPFAVKKADFANIFGEGTLVASFETWTAEFDDDGVPTNITINFKERKNTLATVLAAGTPYLIKPTKENISVITLDGVTIADKQDVTSTFSEDDYYGETFKGSFIPTYVATRVPANGLFIRDEKFYYSKGETVLKGFRGYFDLGLILNEVPEVDIKMQIFVDGEPTDVESLQIRSTNGAVYNIGGQKMGNDVKHLQKGVYIIDGKKVAIK